MTRSWWENEEILRQFRDWLTQTRDEVDSLDDDVCRDVERSELSAFSAELPGEELRSAELPGEELPDVGLLQLVEAFTAMRHELKLYTKGTRNLEATVTRSLEGLGAASRVFESVQADEQGAAHRAALPLVETLVGLDEGLLRAEQAFRSAHRQLTQTAPDRLRARLEQEFARQSWWGRLRTGRWYVQTRELACAALGQAAEEEFASLMEGVRMLQERLARALRDQGIQRIDGTGQIVDPTRMTVVDLVIDSQLPPETVAEVVRPGYLWGDHMVRFAEVRAVARQAGT